MYQLINGRRVVENYGAYNQDDDKESKKGFSTTDWVGIGLASGIIFIIISLLIWASVRKKNRKGGRGRKFKYKFY